MRVHTKCLDFAAQVVLVGELDPPLCPETVESPADSSDVGKIGFDTGGKSPLPRRGQSALRCCEPFGELVALEFKLFEGEARPCPLILSF